MGEIEDDSEVEAAGEGMSDVEVKSEVEDTGEDI